MKRLSSLEAVRQSRTLRHGIGNLYRPGAHSVAILTSLAIGVMFVMSVYFIQHSLLDEIRIAAPPDAPNVFLINITTAKRTASLKFSRASPRSSTARHCHRRCRQPWRLSMEHRSNSSRRASPHDASRIRCLFSHGARTLPAATKILQGKWWDPKPSEPLVSVNEVAAENLGSVWTASWFGMRPAGSIRARVANIRRTDGARSGVNSQFVLSPGALDGFATAYFGAVRVKPGGIGALQKRMFESIPR